MTRFGFSWESAVFVSMVVASWVASLIFMPYLLSLIVANYLQLVPTGINLQQEDKQFQKLVKFGKGLQPLFAKLYEKFLETVERPWVRRGLIGAATLIILVIFISKLLPVAALHQPIVFGHRGSVAGVENSAGAIQGAIEAKADYTEVDLLLSADGIPMVIHDTNLQRLAGLNQNVYDLTAKELQEISIEQAGYQDKIMTLEDAIAICQGKIKLAIELKLHGHEKKDIVTEVMTILEKYKMREESLFVSLEYSLLEKIKKTYPKILVGYCVYGNVGELNWQILRSMTIDFVIIEESMATPKTIDDFRKAWLPVYVWTVNDPKSMNKYLEMGILGLVTDHPDIGVKQVEAYNKNAKVNYLDEADWRD